jgi:hypothetical protein
MSATLTHPARTRAVPRALVRLSARAQAELWGLRLTRLYAFGIGVSYSALLFATSSEPSAATSSWVKCLTTASWVAGLGALSLARDLAERDTLQGVVGLARLRGFGPQPLEQARAVAGAIKLGLTVALPGIMLSLTTLVVERSVSGLFTGLALLGFSVLYAALFGASLSLLSRACARALPTRGRLLFAAVVLGPWLFASGVDAELPSLPGAFAWLLSQLGGIPA